MARQLPAGRSQVASKMSPPSDQRWTCTPWRVGSAEPERSCARAIVRSRESARSERCPTLGPSWILRSVPARGAVRPVGGARVVVDVVGGPDGVVVVLAPVGVVVADVDVVAVLPGDVVPVLVDVVLLLVE